MIRFAQAADIPQLKALWMEAFHDSQQATDFFFERRLRLDCLLIEAQGDQPRAMLTMLPIALVTGGQALPARYFFAIATFKRFQGQGLSTRLMLEAERISSQRGEYAAVLVPASQSLFQFYGKRGYQTAFGYDLLRLQADQLPPCPPDARLLPLEAADMLRLREQAFAGSRLWLRWDEAALDFVRQAAEQYQAPLLRFATDDGEGYAYCEWDDETLIVKELALVGIVPVIAAAILHRELGAKAYALRLQQGTAPGAADLPFGMMKALRPLPEAAGTAPYMSFAKD